MRPLAPESLSFEARSRNTRFPEKPEGTRINPFFHRKTVKTNNQNKRPSGTNPKIRGT
jgi:hypothetical protein